ncbi:hypothetical protein [Butyrivibrio sp. M55]|uniref:hypothetical protein n=1 Tax=Butyrivibrio sp. M55 TaxID=1855323 RepID=UPI0008E5B09B|nr:hypothetical protein [Butyrivibrio sp. M55]SFU67527.1 hypothetical protein SAMN05216540_105252 [Butyrivibrio sp. M55]
MTDSLITLIEIVRRKSFKTNALRRFGDEGLSICLFRLIKFLRGMFIMRTNIILKPKYIKLCYVLVVVLLYLASMIYKIGIEKIKKNIVIHNTSYVIEMILIFVLGFTPVMVAVITYLLMLYSERIIIEDDNITIKVLNKVKYTFNVNELDKVEQFYRVVKGARFQQTIIYYRGKKIKLLEHPNENWENYNIWCRYLADRKKLQRVEVF